jgi:hypothetical protein
MYRFVVSAGIALVASLSVMVVPVSAAPAPPSKLILALDACDAVTFNAALGAGTCSRPGMPLDIFLAQVQRLHQAPAWRFAPGNVSVVPNQPRGGQEHGRRGAYMLPRSITSAGALYPSSINWRAT